MEIENIKTGDYLLVGTNDIVVCLVTNVLTEHKLLTYRKPATATSSSKLKTIKFEDVYAWYPRMYTPIQSYREGCTRSVVQEAVLLSQNIQWGESIYFYVEEGNNHLVQGIVLNITNRSYIVEEYGSHRVFEVRKRT